MKTLIVSDIHERRTKLRHILEELAPKADRVVFLGDFFDTFGVRIPGDIVNLIQPLLYDPKFEFCWGNHDVHYAFPFGKCSGYDFHTQSLLNKMMSPADWKQFKPWTMVGPYLVSHAGFIDETLYLKDMAQEALELAFKGERHQYWNAGRVRGGPARFGGPVWLDWNFEFEPIPDMPQIVGHTVISKGPPVQKGNSWCLDTCNRHVMWVDEEGKVEIEEL